MILSIRRFLLVNLLLSITITITITAIGNYLLDQKDIEQHLDTHLAQTTLVIQALISDDLSKRNMENIQNALEGIPKLAHHTLKSYQEDIGWPHFKGKFQFQVWNNNGRLLLHSVNSPRVPLSDGTIGFSEKRIDHIPWRVFTLYDNNTGLSIVAAERFDIRAELGHRIARDDIYIMLLTYPILGLLIWVIVGKGLNSIKRVTYEVSHRKANYLEAVDLTEVPIEIIPLVDELNRLFLRLQQAFEREKRFAGDAAHELRTPLAALKTQAQVALNTSDNKERREAIHKVLKAVDRSTHVVEQLLTLSRLVPESGSLQDMERFNPGKVAADIIAELAPMAVDSGVDIELIATKPCSIMGNVTAFGILVRNLVDNAIRYSKGQGDVVVEITPKRNYVHLTVTDSGPGIPAELRSRVFERFYRVLGTKQTGSGLGLAIVHQIAHLHNAQVKLGSPASGKGLQVDVIFPKEQT